MFERFTQRAIDTIAYAQAESNQQGHNYVAPEQILLGIMMTHGGIAYEALTAAGVKVRDLREEIRKIIPDAQDQIAVEIPFTNAGKRVLELTWDEARKAKHQHIGDEHLLLGVLRDEENAGVKALVNLNFNIAKIKESVLSKMQ